MLEAGTPLEKAAGELGLEVKQEDYIRRDEGKLDRLLVSRVFSMPRQAGGKPSYAGIELPDGDYEVIVLQEVKDADPGKLDTARRTAFARNLARLSGQRELEAAIESLRARAEIDINEEAIK